MALRTLSLFSGGGGLDLGVALAVPETRVVCFVEREAYASAVLAARMEEDSLDPAPIWSDVSTFDGHPWRGRVDLVSGGFPCQDISVAGKGAGLAGERSGLWREYARIISEVQPRLVFIENVAALRSRGLDQVLADLASLGFDAEWDCFRASDVGAPHRRERVFVLAHRSSERWNEGVWRELEERRRSVSGDGCESVVNPDNRPSYLRPEEGSQIRDPSGASFVVGDSDSRQHYRRESDPRGEEVERIASPGTGCELGDPNNKRLQRRIEPLERGPDEWAPWPPGPEERDRWVEYLRLRPDTEPSICRGPHGVAGALVDRTDRLRLLGNGVVPQVAALAFRTLARRAFTG